MIKEWLYTEKGSKKNNEDVIGKNNNIYWVIDGVSELFENIITKESDIYWFIQELNKELLNNTIFNISLENIIFNAITKIKDNININLKDISQYKLPTFAISMFRVNTNNIEYYCLEDCSLIINIDNNIISLSDNRIEKFTKYNRYLMSQLDKNSKDFETQKLKIYQNTRKKLNTSDGYWIGSLDGIGIKHGISGQINFKENIDILCYSDGLLPLFTNNILEYSEQIFDEKYLQTGIKKFNNILNNNIVTKENTLLLKKKDDLSVILINIRGDFIC